MEEVQSPYLIARIKIIEIIKLRTDRLDPNFLKGLPEFLIIKVLHDSPVELETLVYEISKTSGLQPCQCYDSLGPSFDEWHQLILSLLRLGFGLEVL